MTARLALAFGAIASSIVLVAPAEAAADPSIDGPVQRLGSCATSGNPTDVLLVIDRSASLQDTDPDNARVDAAEYFIERLVDFADATGADMSVAIAGFDVNYEVTRDWAPLSVAEGSRINDHLESYRDAVHGWETDYWVAANGARDSLSDRAEGESRHCQAWVWFSDGSYQLDYRENDAELDDYGDSKEYHDGNLTTQDDVDAAERAGIEDLCRARGVAASLRAADVITLAVGLKAPGDDANFDLMGGLATGENGKGGPACTDGADVSPGLFVQADDLDGLFSRSTSSLAPDRRRSSRINNSAPGISGATVKTSPTYSFSTTRSARFISLLPPTQAQRRFTSRVAGWRSRSVSCLISR